MHEPSAVPARCTMPDGALFDVLASNISEKGLHFYVSNSPVLLVIGNSLTFAFDVALLKGVAATGTIQAMSEVLDMVRFEVVLKEVPEAGKLKLAEYKTAEERQIAHQTTEENAIFEKPVLFVVDEPQTRDHYTFLDQNFSVIHSDSFDVIGRLLAASPDAILFNSDLPDTGMVLQVLTNHPVLKGTPVIEVQKKKRKNTKKFFSSLSFPMDEPLILDALYQAVKARRISKMLRNGEFSGPFKTGISILLIDDSSSAEAHDIEVLRGLGCDVKRIADLKLLYDSFVWSTPDVIAIDENTKEIDARTVCRLLAMNRELKDVPKVLLSKKRGPRDSSRPDLFSCVLTKPLTAKQLLSQIHYLLGQSSR